MDVLWSAPEPHIVALLGVILTVLSSISGRQLAAWAGIEIEKRHREVLHESLISGAMSAIRHGPGGHLEALKAHAIAHARRSVHDAVKTLVPRDSVLDTIAALRSESDEQAGPACAGLDLKSQIPPRQRVPSLRDYCPRPCHAWQRNDVLITDKTNDQDAK
jgi:hypothetical protein